MRRLPLLPLAFGVSVGLLIAVGIVSYRSIDSLLRADQRVEQSREALYTLEQLLSELKDAETGQRGYIITGDESFLVPYNAVSAKVPRLLERLHGLVADNKTQMAMLAELRPKMGERLALIQETVRVRREFGLERAAEIVASGRGNVIMDAIRRQVGTMFDEEYRLLAARRKSSNEQARQALYLYPAGTILGIFLMALVFLMLRRQVKERANAEAALRVLTDELEIKVAERTGELVQSNINLTTAIDQQRQTEASLRDTNLRLQGLVDSAPFAVYLLDTLGRVTLWNPAAERIFGYTVEEAIGRTPPHIAPGVQHEFAETFPKYLHERHSTQFEARRQRKDGSAIELIIAATPLHDEAGTPVGLMVVATDVTEQRTAEEQLRQAQKMEAVGQLTGGVAHDFNNLLTVIQGNAELLREITAEQPVRDYAATILRAAERGAELTQRLLAFSRRQALRPESLNLNSLIDEMGALLQRTLREDAELKIAPGRDLWRVTADPTQVENALLNLALNARDAMPQGGKLTVETQNVELSEDYSALHQEVRPGPYVMIAVSDTGTGMTPEIMSRAFEPFFTTKEVGKGSGLGLSMVYGFVKQSGGHLKIYSEFGHGTSVKIYLPKGATQSDAPAPAIETEAVPGGVESVLVVEDDPLVRSYVSEQLRDLGYRVTEAADGRIALEALRRGVGFDLLFTDVVMPGGMNGRQLADQARLLSPRVKVLFTSGYTENAIVHHGKLDAGVHLLNKPYRKAELARAVRRRLDEPQIV